MIYHICAIIKDEQLFLKEWIDYHLNLGFNKIVLFEDFDSTSHKDITDSYDNVELIPLRDNTLGIKKVFSSYVQLQCYNHYLQYCKNTKCCDWCLFTDVDEFLVFQEGYDLNRLCSEYKDNTAIILSWKFYNANGHIKRPKGGVVESYTQVCNTNGDRTFWSIKSFANINVNPKFMDIHHIHHGIKTNGSYDLESPLNYEKAWLNHYFTKSWEDYCNRIFKRGNMSNNYRCFDAFFKSNPDMQDKEEELLNSVRYRHANSTMYISRKHKIISGGNLDVIRNLNKQT